ncbi:putative protein N(5)-glutamine methyltransferase [Cellulomonas carbonis]|uniref:putative protein N(5)-glutamine methyltransferase n=1 Tax=Cellulomonas carbonis TaxID=1386092 RepID=UPI001EED01AE
MRAAEPVHADDETRILPSQADDGVVRRLRAAGCVFAEDEARLLRAQADGDLLDALVTRRVAGEPLEHVLGWAELAGVRVVVAPGVFVPRRRTTLMVEEATRLARAATAPRPVVVDLCCGTGAVGLVVALRTGDVELHAVDVDPAAVRCAQDNLARVGGRARTGDLTAGLPHELRGRVDVVVANVPYVPTDEVRLLPPESRLHEPVTAVDGGPDGLGLVRRVLSEAASWLARPGHVLVEVAAHQVPDAEQAARAADLVPRTVRDDDLDAVVLVASAR